MLSRYTLYSLCAQDPPRDARLLRAIFADATGTSPRGKTLGEDFSAAAAIARFWCVADPNARAVAVDLDSEALSHAIAHPRLKLVQSDVRNAKHPADLIAALNFSVCELHQRKALVTYFKRAFARLRSPGLFICDIYGGADSFTTGIITDSYTLPDSRKVTYQWEQRTADPATARVTNAMHFTVHPRAKKGTPERFPDAFVYDWRLWSIPELSDALRDAGFTDIRVYPRTPGAIDSHGDFHIEPVMDASELGETFNVFVVAGKLKPHALKR